MTISWQTIIAAASIIGALAAIISYYNKAYDFIRQQKKDNELQVLLLEGVLACLQGLIEQGCDGEVHKAEAKIKEYLIASTRT